MVYFFVDVIEWWIICSRIEIRGNGYIIGLIYGLYDAFSNAIHFPVVRRRRRTIKKKDCGLTALE